MATFTIKDLSFIYPQKEQPALSNINLTVEYGEFAVVCGQTGCGKSTLLRNLKTVLAPHGKLTGEVYFYDRPLNTVDFREQASRIGYVLQNPDNQIVTDKVWHELAFGLESLGYDTKTIRLRVAEMASFFGIQSWFMKDVPKLSGGQKQLLNLASIMAMQPDVLILDEPTSQLDPIAATDFLETVKKINQEIGTTVIITEHRLEDVLPMADKVIVMDKGRIIAKGKADQTGKILQSMNHPMMTAMPAPMQIFSAVGDIDNAYNHSPGITGKDDTRPEGKARSMCPITVREGRNWLTGTFSGRTLAETKVEDPKEKQSGEEPVIKLKDVWFRYSRDDDDVIKGLSMEVFRGEFYCIVGGNATGKTTALSIIGGINKPYRGKVTVKGQNLTKHVDKEKFNGFFGILPQNPQALFVEKTVALDLMEALQERSLSSGQKEERIRTIAETVEITDLMDMHPYDLSGGEQQRVALAKVLLLDPQIILLDEPTKGIDSHFKEKLAGILKKLTEAGAAIVAVSHDIEFCGKYGDRCSMFFNGNIVTTNTPNKFFSGNSFYTTAANRMSRHIFENAVTIKDVITLCQKNLIKQAE